MGSTAEECAGTRLARVLGLIQDGSLFQASAVIAGGRRCAQLRNCDHWHDCIWAYTILADHVSARATAA